jgi:hypothetical protein
MLTIRNETDCIVRFRFDNGINYGAVLPHSEQRYSDERLDDYRFLKLESTMAIFRTLDMQDVRADGYRATVRPAPEDGECFDLPPSPAPSPSRSLTPP